MFPLLSPPSFPRFPCSAATRWPGGFKYIVHISKLFEVGFLFFYFLLQTQDPSLATCSYWWGSLGSRSSNDENLLFFENRPSNHWLKISNLFLASGLLYLSVWCATVAGETHGMPPEVLSGCLRIKKIQRFQLMGLVFLGPILATSALPLLARPSFVLKENAGKVN